MRPFIIIRGGGDLATGVAQKFVRSGFRVLILETQEPTAIRRGVSLSEAVYDDEARVEDMLALQIYDPEELESFWQVQPPALPLKRRPLPRSPYPVPDPPCYALPPERPYRIPVLVDPAGDLISDLKPLAVIDATMSKTPVNEPWWRSRYIAPITIGLGPGFTAGGDVDAVIETMRGHDLGRIIFQGSAREDTGVPGEVGGKSAQRVLYAPVSGLLGPVHDLGDRVEEGECIFEMYPCDTNPYLPDSGVRSVMPILLREPVLVTAPFTGILRGLIRTEIWIPKGLKCVDIDPRLDTPYDTISDKARALGGAALEAFLYLLENRMLLSMSDAISSPGIEKEIGPDRWQAKFRGRINDPKTLKRSTFPLAEPWNPDLW